MNFAFKLNEQVSKNQYCANTPKRAPKLSRFDIKKFADPSFNDRRRIEHEADLMSQRSAFAVLPMLNARDL